MGSEFRWIAGSLISVIIFGTGLLVYGIMEANTSKAENSASLESNSNTVIKIDSWQCVISTDRRGTPYEYSRNARNGATGPASVACKKD